MNWGSIMQSRGVIGGGQTWPQSVEELSRNKKPKGKPLSVRTQAWGGREGGVNNLKAVYWTRQWRFHCYLCLKMEQVHPSHRSFFPKVHSSGMKRYFYFDAKNFCNRCLQGMATCSWQWSWKKKKKHGSQTNVLHQKINWWLNSISNKLCEIHLPLLISMSNSCAFIKRSINWTLKGPW